MGHPAVQVTGGLRVTPVEDSAAIERLRSALDQIFSLVSYINIHGVGEQPEAIPGCPQPIKASPDEFWRIWNQIGDIASAALCAGHAEIAND